MTDECKTCGFREPEECAPRLMRGMCPHERPMKPSDYWGTKGMMCHGCCFRPSKQMGVCRFQFYGKPITEDIDPCVFIPIWGGSSGIEATPEQRAYWGLDE